MPSRLPSRLLLPCMAAFHYVLQRSRLPRMPPRRILVAHHLLLGDLFLLTPLLAKLRASYPDAEIVLMVRPAAEALYAGRPYGVRAAAYDPKDAGSLWRLFDAKGYDVAIVPGDNRFCYLARALGSRSVVAFEKDLPSGKSRSADRLVSLPAEPVALGDLFAQLVPGGPPPPYDPVQWPAPACPAFELPQVPYAVLHVGASTPLKQWPVERWRALALWLQAQGITPVWSCGPGEESLVAAIDPDGRSYTGTLSLAQLWRLLQGASALVCPDTSVAHLGRIVGVPTVALFGPGSANIHGAGAFWATSPYRAITVDPFPCRDQSTLFGRHLPWARRCGRSLNECGRPFCMEAISLEAVCAALASAANLDRLIPA